MLTAMSPKSEPGQASSSGRWNGRFSITITLATAISLLVLVSVGSVLGVGVWLAGKNTLALMSLNANQGLANTVDRIEQHLLPAEDQARFIARQIAKGEIDPNDRAAFGRLLTGALAGVRQIAAVSFVDTGLKSFTAARREGDDAEVSEFDLSRDPEIRRNRGMMSGDPQWAAPVWRGRHGKTFFNLVHPVQRGGRFIGAVGCHRLDPGTLRLRSQGRQGRSRHPVYSVWARSRAGAPGHDARLSRPLGR